MPDDDDEAPKDPTPPFLPRPAQDLSPRASGWRDPRDLLHDLLNAFGLPKAPGPPVPSKATPRLLGNAPSEGSEYLGRFCAEVEAASPLLQDLLGRLDGIPTRRIPSAKERKALRAICKHWNARLVRQGWWTLPPLCEMCGLPVIRRGVEQTKRGPQLSTVCSESCRRARKS